MALFQARVTTPRSGEDVFEYLSDFRTVAEWDPGVLRARRLDSGAVREGSRFAVVVSLLGRELELVYRVLEIDPPHRVVLEARNSWLRSHDVIRVLPEDGGSRVEYDALLDLRGPARLLDPGLQLGFDRVGRDAARGLARALGGHWREERAGRSLLPCVWISRELEVPAVKAWEQLVDTTAWAAWSPSIEGVECRAREIRLGSRGRIRTRLGLWLPFEVDVYRPLQEWSWRVAGVPATRHRVNAIAPGRCRVEFGVPVPAAPYRFVCGEALERLAERLEDSRAWGSAA